MTTYENTLNYNTSKVVMSMSTKEMTTKEKKAQLKRRIEGVFSRYRLIKYFTPTTSHDTKITANYSEQERVTSSNISDQTAKKAIQIADQEKERQVFIESVEAAIERLPDIEREIIEIRYMSRDSDYITDFNVYEFKLSNAMSSRTYNKIRNAAFIKLALYLMLDVGFDLTEGI